jgi:tetratricopeptide (TPR) repeat protein
MGLGWSAAREMKHAIELKPSDAWARAWYTNYLTVMGRHEQAIAEIRRAQELDPLSPRLLAAGCNAYRDAGRYDESIEQARKAFTRSERRGHHVLGLTYILKGWRKKPRRI